METASPATMSRNMSLDAPPPQPPGGASGSFMPTPKNGGDGLGELANSPQLMTMQGLAMAKDAFQLIANGQPDLAQILANTINDLEQMVAQAMAAAQAGQQPGVNAPPGAPPMPPPPMAGGPGGMPPGGGAGPGPMPGM
jgi:hypothetical protein